MAFRSFVERLALVAVMVVALGSAGLAWSQSQPASAPDASQPETSSPAATQAATQSSQPASQPVEQAREVTQTLPQAWLDSIPWRSIGPANMGGRITAISVSLQDHSLWYVATASGGLLKTINSGMSFEHLFDREATVSIGDVACAPSDHNIVWIGTGEANPRNSSSWGDGVYKSIDGGKTWKNMGLKRGFQTGQIAIHPTDPNIVYVGVLGRLWGHNDERGLYKTVDGGENWNKVLHVDDMTGVIDVKMQPGNPEVLLCATYERQRDGHDGNDPVKKFGPGSAIHRSTDGGATWVKVTQGLPTVKLGRIGLEWYAKDANIVYAIIETEKIAQEPENAAFAGFVGEDADVGCRITRIEDDSPASKAGLKVGDIIVRINETTIQSAEAATAEVRKHLAGETVKIEVSRERKPVTMDLTFEKRPGAEEDQASTQPGTQPTTRPAAESESGGEEGEEQSEQERARAERQREAARTPFSSGLGGQRENVQEQQGPDGHEYGGLYKSEDAGITWKRINSVNPRPMYYSEVRVDPSDNKYIWVLGTSLYMSEDGGTTFKSGMEGEAHVDHHAMWIDPRDGRHVVLGNDGGVYQTFDRAAHWDHLNTVAIGQFYHVSVDPRRDGMVYGGLQDNGTWGGPMRVRDNPGPINEDWFSVSGGDGFISFVDPNDPDVVFSSSQNGAVGWRNMKTGSGGSVRPRGERGIRLRWNWETPYVLSSHNPRIVYTAGNYAFRSFDRGSNLQRISPELTVSEQGTASAISESPRDAGVLYVGTDDGQVWVTRNGGNDWTNVFAAADAATQPQATTTSAPAEDAPRSGRGSRGGGGPSRAGTEGSGEGEGRATGRGQFDPSRMAEQLRNLDANGDGRIERSELPRRMVAMFGRFDRNNDGAIDADEIAELTGQPRTDPPATQPSTQPSTQPATAPTTQPEAAAPSEPAEPATTQPQTEAQTQPATSDPVTGAWEGQVISDEVPRDQGGFTFSLQLAEDAGVTGRMTTRFNEGDVSGRFNRDNNRLEMTMETEQFNIVYTATVSAAGMTGRASVGDGMFEFDFEARRTSAVSTSATPTPRAQAGAGQRSRGGRGATSGGGPGGAQRAPEGKPLKELLPGPRWVSSLEASRAAPGRVYVTFDGHRSDDDEPYIMVSEDYGSSWRSLRANLPTSAGSTKCVREDIVNPSILYLGCEFSAWVSIDRGESWTRIANLPTVAVHDFAQHPVTGEVVAGTHGRSLWVADVSPLRSLNAEALSQRAVLCTPGEAFHIRREPSRAGTLRRFEGANPSSGAAVHYVLNRPAQRVKLQILDPITGEVLRDVDGERGAGMYRVDWDLRRVPPPAPPQATASRGGRGGGFRRGGALVPPGLYRVVLTVDDQTFTQALRVSGDPAHPDYRPWQTEEQELELERLFEEDEAEPEELEVVN